MFVSTRTSPNDRRPIPTFLEGVIDAGKLQIIIVRFNRLGSYMACGASNGYIALFDCITNDITKRWNAHSQAISSLSWTRDGKQILSTAIDYSLVISDVATGTVVKRLFLPVIISYAELNPRYSEKFLYVTANGINIRTLTSEDRSQISPSPPSQSITTVIYDHTGDYIICGTANGYILAFDQNGSQVARSVIESPSPIKHLYPTRRTGLLIITASDKYIRIAEMATVIRLENGERLDLVNTLSDILSETWHSTCASELSNYVAGIHERAHAITIWERATGNIVKNLSRSEFIAKPVCIAWHPTKPVVVSVIASKMYRWIPKPHSNYAAFMQDFEGTDGNIDYEEKEGEFDELDEDADDDLPGPSVAVRQSPEFIDIETIRAPSPLRSSDEDESNSHAIFAVVPSALRPMLPPRPQFPPQMRRKGQTTNGVNHSNDVLTNSGDNGRKEEVTDGHANRNSETNAIVVNRGKRRRSETDDDGRESASEEEIDADATSEANESNVQSSQENSEVEDEAMDDDVDVEMNSQDDDGATDDDDSMSTVEECYEDVRSPIKPEHSLVTSSSEDSRLRSVYPQDEDESMEDDQTSTSPLPSLLRSQASSLRLSEVSTAFAQSMTPLSPDAVDLESDAEEDNEDPKTEDEEEKSDAEMADITLSTTLSSTSSSSSSSSGGSQPPRNCNMLSRHPWPSPNLEYLQPTEERESLPLSSSSIDSTSSEASQPQEGHRSPPLPPSPEDSQPPEERESAPLSSSSIDPTSSEASQPQEGRRNPPLSPPGSQNPQPPRNYRTLTASSSEGSQQPQGEQQSSPLSPIPEERESSSSSSSSEDEAYRSARYQWRTSSSSEGSQPPEERHTSPPSPAAANPQPPRQLSNSLLSSSSEDSQPPRNQWHTSSESSQSPEGQRSTQLPSTSEGSQPPGEPQIPPTPPPSPANPQPAEERQRLLSPASSEGSQQLRDHWSTSPSSSDSDIENRPPVTPLPSHSGNNSQQHGSS